MTDLTDLAERLKLYQAALANTADPVDRVEAVYKMACFLHGTADGVERAAELFAECRNGYVDLEGTLEGASVKRRERIVRGAFGAHWAAATAAHARKDLGAARAAAVEAIRLGELCIADNIAAAAERPELADVGLRTQLGAVQMFLATLA